MLSRLPANDDPGILAALPRGQAGRIVALDGDRSFRRRLLELGLVPGTSIRVVRSAPFGGPLEVEVRGGRLSLRRSEAALVRVELVRAQTTDPTAAGIAA